MTTLNISQSDASKAMIAIGATEVFSRAGISCFGDRFKGYMLHLYSISCLPMTITNILGYFFASSYAQLLIYGVGRWLNPSNCNIMQLCFCEINCSFPSLFMCWNRIFPVLGLFGGPIIAAMYASCFEVLSGEHVPALFSAHSVGCGIGMILGPTLAGKHLNFSKYK